MCYFSIQLILITIRTKVSLELYAMIHDEFYWISQVNKASVVSNSEENLLDKATAKFAARGIVTVEQQAQADVSKRVNKYIAYEPMLIAATGPEVTILHAGRSSQDILSTMRVAILREQTINLSAAFDAVIEKLLVLAEAHRDTVVPNYTNGVAAQPNPNIFAMIFVIIWALALWSFGSAGNSQ